MLVSNRHYCKKDISADQLPSVFADCPVVCKLADFGESRSTLIQTASIIHAKTMNIERGTKPYIARREIELREAGTGVMTMIIKILERRRHSMEKNGQSVFVFPKKNLWGTKDDLYSFAFHVGSIHRSIASDSSTHESASSDDSLLEDPFSLQYTSDISLFSSRVRKYIKVPLVRAYMPL